MKAVYEIKVKLNDEQMREIRAIREEAIDHAVRAEAKLAAVFALAEKCISKEEDGSWSEREGSDERIPPRQVTRIIDYGVEPHLVEVRADQYVQLTNGKYTTSIILDEAPTSGLAMLIMLGDEE